MAWLRAYAGMGQAAATTQSLVVGQPGFAAGLAVLADKARLDTWRTYRRVRALDAMAEYDPHTVASAHFGFYNGAIRGLKAAPPRVEQVILMVGGRTGGLPLGETLARCSSPKPSRRWHSRASWRWWPTSSWRCSAASTTAWRPLPSAGRTFTSTVTSFKECGKLTSRDTNSWALSKARAAP